MWIGLRFKRCLIMSFCFYANNRYWSAVKIFISYSRRRISTDESIREKTNTKELFVLYKAFFSLTSSLVTSKTDSSTRQHSETNFFCVNWSFFNDEWFLSLISAYVCITEGLAHIMQDLFAGVVYAGIDTDKHKYPIGKKRNNLGFGLQHHSNLFVTS